MIIVKCLDFKFMYQCPHNDKTFAHCKMETKCVRREHFSANKLKNIYINRSNLEIFHCSGRKKEKKNLHALIQECIFQLLMEYFFRNNKKFRIVVLNVMYALLFIYHLIYKIMI